jgi:Fur family ferric uptake transcriptional regulator
MQRITNQKIIILDFLRKTKTHPSAEQVFLEVQKKLPRISKATVYRVLADFVKNGAIQSVAGKITRFDGNKQTHQHFTCKGCGNIADLYNTKIEKYLTEKQALIEEGSVDNFEVNFYGKCKKCKN